MKYTTLLCSTLLPILLGLLLLATGCDSTSPENEEVDEEWLLSLRQATEEYKDVDVAINDGFVNSGDGCVENPDGPGTLGIPYVHPDRLSDDAVDPVNPEVLFYEPQPDGSLRLAGVENALPIDLWDGSEPPSLFGHGFHRNEEEGLYGIHFWIWKDNPAGDFAMWHTDVSCEYAE